MKTKFTILTFFFIQLLFSQNFHDTQGKLDVSSGGQAVYTLPIALPPSIKSVGPTINLTYASGQLGGIAGQGWNISTISSITRMATRKDIDGFVDGVDFDDNDKLAFEGQRLILKSGTYWADGSVYETEVQSNTKIQLYGSGTNIYFIVTAPDGSRSWYGNYNNSNAFDTTAYYVVRFEDINANYISYNYTLFNGTLCIDEIRFSANQNAGITPQNKIKFNYKLPQRIETAFIKGVRITKKALLDGILVYTNNLLFRQYSLTHISDPVLGYQKLKKIQEFNGNNEPANPIEFEYDISTTQPSSSEKTTTYFNNINFDDVELSGDFDGDGRLDFSTTNFLYTNLFNNNGTGFPTPMPFLSTKRVKIAGTTIANGKLGQQQSVIHAKENSNSIDFKIYNLSGGIFANTQTKSINIANTATLGTVTLGQIYLAGGWPSIQFCEPFDGIKKATTYLEGDFNGDGISEILMYHKNQETQNYHTDSYYEVPNSNGDFRSAKCTVTFTNHDSDISHYLIDLNPSTGSSLNSDGFVKFNNSLLGNFTDKKYTADYNGDGKSDILVIKEDKTYKVIGFKQLNAAPWVELEVLGEGFMEDYSSTKQILFGDFDGDGKADIMMPHHDGGGCTQCIQWYIYYSNPNPNGGAFFTKEVHNIVEYRPDTGTYLSTQRHLSSYYALDTNGDGKSDLVRVWRKFYKPELTINNHNTQWQITSYVNNIGNTAITGNKFTPDYGSPCVTVNSPFGPIQDCLHDSDMNELPMPIVSNYKNQGLNNEILMIRRNYAQLTYIDFNKDVGSDVLLKKVISSGGNVVNELKYNSLEPVTGGLNDFYSSSNSLNYPNVEIKRLPTTRLVNRLTNKVGANIKHQDFKYNGYILNLRGLGAIGFNKIARSSWFKNEGNNRIWSVSEYDALNRGAIKRTYSQMASDASSFSFVNAGLPSGVINSTTSTFNSFTTNNVYHLLLNNQVSQDFLTGITNETIYNYDPQYFLPLTTISINKLGSSEQGRTTTTNTFTSNTSGVGSGYYIGKPLTSSTVVSAYGGTAQTSSEMSYTNGNLTKIKKKGNTADNKYLVEEFQYDAIGNVTKQISKTEGYTMPYMAPRTTEFTYDNSKRYVKTTKDFQGLIATNNTYHPLYGIVTSTTNPFGQTNTIEVDSWGKITKTTNYLGKSGYSTYSKNGNQYVVNNTSDDGGASTSITDATGLVVKKGQKNIDNTWSHVSSEYDYLGRKIKESEPYNYSPQLWNTSQFDDYGRLVSETKSTGLVTSLIYSGLTVTGTDVTKTTSSVKNANGHLVSSSDNGGTINFSYYPDGSLKTSNYEGTIISTEYNEWGKKTKLTDPSAGTYTYAYLPTGETTSETTPKGTTTYNFDLSTGQLNGKGVQGDLTNSKTSYTYHPVYKSITSSVFNDIQEGQTITTSYTYNTDLTLDSVTEVNNNSATYGKTFVYDGFGRVNTETYLVTNNLNGHTVNKSINHTYKNGAHYEMIDANTNQSLWKTNTVNERGQATNATSGSITVTNGFDPYGNPFYTSHDFFNENIVVDGQLGANVNLFNFQTNVEPRRGNLLDRTNSFFGQQETFTYDNLDRLIKWGGYYQTIKTMPFDIDLEGFASHNGALVTHEAGRVKTEATTTTSGTKGLLVDNMTVNDKVKISFDLENIDTQNIRIFLEERNLSTGATQSYLKGGAILGTQTISFEHTVLQHNQLYLRVEKWIKNNSFPQPTTFYIDNIKIEKLIVETQDYDNKGRVTQNKIGTYGYTDTNKKYRNTSVTPTPLGTEHYTNRPLLDIQYNVFKSPVSIYEENHERINFDYNDGNDRATMYYGGLEENKLERPYRKFYSAIMPAEITYNVNENSSNIVLYLGGDGYTAPLVLKSNKETEDYLFLHRDYQGSILGITNATTGQTLEKRHFDPWGNVVMVQDADSNNLDKLTLLDRGYTGHEHLQGVGLIHMNGRLYDPILHRFLQPDNYVTDPNNTQTYNRYAYVMNNPLKYSDVNGEEPITLLTAVIVGAVISAATYTLTALLADVPFTVGGFVQASFIGAFSGAVTFGIGQYATTIGNFWQRAAFQALAHGTFQGGMTAAQGGEFWTGFASGSLASIASSLWAGGPTNDVTYSVGSHTVTFGNRVVNGIGGSFASSTAGILLFGTLAGGAGAELTGGNFWQGAITGLIVSGLNHAMHSGDGDSSVSIDDQEDPYQLKPFKPLTYQERLNRTGVIYEDNSIFEWFALGKVADAGYAGLKGLFSKGGYASFAAFKAANGAAGKGMAWHHIVEQGGSNVAKFGATKVHNVNNLVKLEHGAGSIHAKISGYYSSKRPFTGGQTVRQWLSTQTYKQQYDFGIKTMKQFGWKP